MNSDKPSNPWECTCQEHRRMMRRQTANGAIVVGLQCARCGKWKAVKKTEVTTPLDNLPWYDTDLQERVQLAWSKQCQAEWEQEKDAHSREWWSRYNEYLLTGAWKRRREKVLRRAHGVCEACLENPATQVHHTTYRHLFNEPLFELRAVCTECHELITELDRKDRI